MNWKVNNILDNMPELDTPDNSSDFPGEAGNELAYVEGIDPRLKLLSHSSRSTLHKCARKFQLYRLNSLIKEAEDTVANSYQQLTFDFGTAVGIGIQNILAGKDLDSTILEVFLAWEGDILLRNSRQNKSFAEAILAVQQFASIVEQGYLKEYELLQYNGKPAVELSFRINLPGCFTYRGYIDAVLRHKVTGAVVILEDKTTSYKEVNPAQYKNSGQGLGYSVMLDHIAPGLSSYTVLYLVYTTPRKEFIELPFEKSSLQRSLWLTSLLIDCKHIEMYESFGAYSMNGDFCYDFYRECEYLGLCTLSTERLVKPLTKKMLQDLEEKEVYDFDFDFEDLVQTQLDKIT